MVQFPLPTYASFPRMGAKPLTSLASAARTCSFPSATSSSTQGSKCSTTIGFSRYCENPIHDWLISFPFDENNNNIPEICDAAAVLTSASGSLIRSTNGCIRWSLTIGFLNALAIWFICMLAKQPFPSWCGQCAPPPSAFSHSVLPRHIQKPPCIWHAMTCR